MAIDAVKAVHSSPAVQNIEAVDNAQRDPNPESAGIAPHGRAPQDRVTISPAAQPKQAATSGYRHHDSGAQ